MLRRHSIAHRVTLNSTYIFFNLEYCKIDNAHFQSFFFASHLFIFTNQMRIKK